MAVDAGTVVSTLIVCGVMGMIGQGVRAVIGLKNMASQSGPSQQSEFSAAYLLISLMIGFIAGIAAGLLVGLNKFTNIDLGDTKLLLGLAAAGYAGADFIENAAVKLIPTIGGEGPNTNRGDPAKNGLPDRGDAGQGGKGVQQPPDTNAAKSPLSTLQLNEREGNRDAATSELSRDLEEARKYLAAIQSAAKQANLTPSVICAIGSRESNWGQGSDLKPKGPGGTGDWAPRNPRRRGYAMPPDGLGWGRGLMQIDYGAGEFGKTGPWTDASQNILYGANELARNRQHFTQHPLEGVDSLRAAIAAYNCGAGNVERAVSDGYDVDRYTTGGNYSSDVLTRAAWFLANGFDKPQSAT